MFCIICYDHQTVEIFHLLHLFLTYYNLYASRFALNFKKTNTGALTPLNAVRDTNLNNKKIGLLLLNNINYVYKLYSHFIDVTCVFIMYNNLLILCRKISSLYSENSTKPISSEKVRRF
jgi:hypothetical protein